MMTREQKMQILGIRCHGNLQRMVEQAVDEILVLTEQLKVVSQRKLRRRK